MPSKWIEFVKEWAKKNSISYGCALSNTDMKKEYYSKYPKKVKKGAKKFDASNVNVIDLEEAIPSGEPKSKNITIKKPKNIKKIKIIGKTFIYDSDTNILYDVDSKKPVAMLENSLIQPLETGKKKTKVSRIEIEGTKYLYDELSMLLYDEDTREVIGIYNKKDKTLFLYDDEEDDEDDEED